MTWETIGVASQIAGSVAVVLTLVYVAKQTRENTRSTNTAAAGTYMQAYSAAWSATAALESGRIFHTGLHAPDELTDTERPGFECAVASFLPLWESLFTMYRAGTVAPVHWTVARDDITWIAHYPGGADFVRRCVASYGQAYPEFAAELSSCLESESKFRLASRAATTSKES
ncbi:MAG TPA: hypothetical protein QGG47_00370 [Acidobacteriota bacterium]|nr:hypothetical protein [Acidobacteriota bacterium]